MHAKKNNQVRKTCARSWLNQACIVATAFVFTSNAFGQCNPNFGGATGLVQGTAQAGALNEAGHVKLTFTSLPVSSDPAIPTSLALDTGIANSSTTRVATDLATATLGFAGTAFPSASNFSLALASTSFFDYLCFDLPDGMATADIQFTINISGSIDCANGGTTCIAGGSNWPTGLRFQSINGSSVNITEEKRLVDIALPNDQIVVNVTVEEGEVYNLALYTGGAVQFDGSFNFTDSIRLSMSTPDGVSYESVTGAFLTAPDTDGDNVFDVHDNCTLVANADQRDTDSDGYGNLCDPDFDNNGIVNFLDLSTWTPNFGTNSNGDLDLNGDGVLNFLDFSILTSFFQMPPGPSGIAP